LSTPPQIEIISLKIIKIEANQVKTERLMAITGADIGPGCAPRRDFERIGKKSNILVCNSNIRNKNSRHASIGKNTNPLFYQQKK